MRDITTITALAETGNTFDRAFKDGILAPVADSTAYGGRWAGYSPLFASEPIVLFSRIMFMVVLVRFEVVDGMLVIVRFNGMQGFLVLMLFDMDFLAVVRMAMLVNMFVTVPMHVFVCVHHIPVAVRMLVTMHMFVTVEMAMFACMCHEFFLRSFTFILGDPTSNVQFGPGTD